MREIISRFQSAVSSLFRHDAERRELDDEIALHVELRAADLVKQGVAPADAARRARVELGNVIAIKESSREARQMSAIDSVIQDVHFALRMMRKHLLFSAVIVLSLGFGIGAVTTGFSIIDSLDLQELPFPNAASLVWLAEVTPANDKTIPDRSAETSEPTAIDWARALHSYSRLDLVQQAGYQIDFDGNAETFHASIVTPGFFTTLGVKPILGRSFVLSDTLSTSPTTMIVSYQFWQTKLGGDSNVIGKIIKFHSANNIAPTVIGVLPPDFRFVGGTDIWRPFKARPNLSRMARGTTVVAQLKPDATTASAAAELQVATARLAATYPEAYKGWHTSVKPLRAMFAGWINDGRFLLTGIACVVLCVAVLNVSGLLLGRAAARRNEIAMRTALGASRGRLIRQLAVEGAMVGVVGCVVGLALTHVGLKFIPRWFSLERAQRDIGISASVLAVSLLVSLGAGIVSAVLPAFRSIVFATSTTLRPTSTPSSKSKHVASVLVCAQFALALVLVSAATFLAHDFLAVRYTDLGYDPAGLYTAGLAPVNEKVEGRAFENVAMSVQQEVSGLANISAATLEASRSYPKIVRSDAQATSVVDTQSFIANWSGGKFGPELHVVGSNYFDAMHMRLLTGRAFNARDNVSSEPVAIINRSAAKRLWGDVNPIGRRLVVGDSEANKATMTVVGIVEDVERTQSFERHWPSVYRALSQIGLRESFVTLTVRLKQPSPVTLGAIRRIAENHTGRHPSALPYSEEESLNSATFDKRSNTIALDVFAAFALVLASMGLYGTTSQAVTQRTREIGIRMALGADAFSVTAAVARRGFTIVLVGAICGTLAAIASSKILRAFVAGTSVQNIPLIISAALAMCVIASVATLIPALRATKVDPTIALRAD